MADRLAPLVVARGLGSFMDYYYFLKYAEDHEEWPRVMDALAVHETYFWREIDQLRAVVDVVVPQLARREKTTLRIWSVPCATGEEPLTLAMLLSEAGWFERLPIELLASDASPEAIARAKQGSYGQRSFRNLPAALQEKYFVPADHSGPSCRICIGGSRTTSSTWWPKTRCAATRRLRSSSAAMSSSISPTRAFDAPLSVFERAMPVPGYLCVGASESLLRRTVAFELQDIGGAFMYVKDGPGDEPHLASARVERAS